MIPEARARLRARADYILTSVQTDDRDRFVALSPEDVSALLDALDAADREIAKLKAMLQQVRNEGAAAEARVAALERDLGEAREALWTRNEAARERDEYGHNHGAWCPKCDEREARVAALTAALREIRAVAVDHPHSHVEVLAMVTIALDAARGASYKGSANTTNLDAARATP